MEPTPLTGAPSTAAADTHTAVTTDAGSTPSTRASSLARQPDLPQARTTPPRRLSPRASVRSLAAQDDELEPTVAQWHEMTQTEGEPPALRDPESALARPRPRAGLLARTARHIDIVGTYDQADNLAFRHRIGDPGRALAGGFTAAGLRAFLGEQRAGIRDAELPADIRALLLRDVDAAESDLDSVVNDKTGRDKLYSILTRLAMSPVPILLPLLSHPVQWKGAAMILASYAKTSAWWAAYHFMMPTADSKYTWKKWVDRDAGNIIPTVLQLPTLSGDPKIGETAQGIPYSVFVAVASLSSLIVLLFGRQLMRNVANPALRGDARPARLDAFAAELSPETRLAVMEMGVRSGRELQKLKNETAGFRAEGGRFSDGFDWQVSQIVDKLSLLQKDMFRLANVPIPVDRHEDTVVKWIMALVTAATLAAPIRPVTNVGTPEFELIPFIDMAGVDGPFALLNQVLIAMDPSQGRQQSQDVYSQWVGFSGVMAWAFGINVAVGDPVAAGGKAFGAFTLGLAAANMTVASLTGKAMGAAIAWPIERILEALKSGDPAAARRSAQELGEAMLAQMRADVALRQSEPSIPRLESAAEDAQDRIVELVDEEPAAGRPAAR